MIESLRPTAKGGHASSLSNRAMIQAISFGLIRTFRHKKHRPKHLKSLPVDFRCGPIGRVLKMERGTRNDDSFATAARRSFKPQLQKQVCGNRSVAHFSFGDRRISDFQATLQELF